MATTAPTNLAIQTSNHKTFTCKWERGGSYSAQWFQYSLNGSSYWTSVDTYNTQTAQKITLSGNQSLSQFTFRIRGYSSDGWSSWSTYSLVYRSGNTSGQQNLNITTSDHKTFKCWWGLGDSYGEGQQFQYTIDGGAHWISQGVSSTQTGAAVTLSGNQRFTTFTFRVCGKKSPTWETNSSGSTYTTYDWSSWVSSSVRYDTANTSGPTNLSIGVSNNNRTFTCRWTIADTNYNAGQQFQYSLNDSSTWTSVSISKDQTSAQVNLSASLTLTKFSFRVRGRRSSAWDSNASSPTYITYDWSSWSSESFTLPKTDAPSNLSITRSNMWFTCSWDINTPTGAYGAGQEVQYRINGAGNWTNVSISNSRSRVSIEVTVPSGIVFRQFTVRVRGKQAASGGSVYEWSSWTTKTMDVPVDSNEKTKAPTGLTITRNLLSFTCEWKIAAGDHNAGQQFQYRLGNSKTWLPTTSTGISVTQTSKKISLSATNYFPYAQNWLVAFSFRVRGRQATKTDTNGKRTLYSWSDWKEYKMTLNRPYTPTWTTELDSTNEYTTKFTWHEDYQVDDNRPFAKVLWQSILVKNSDVTDGSKLKWSSSNSGWRTGQSNYNTSEGDITITEDSAMFTNGVGQNDVYGPSYTRWVRACGQGAYGWSGGWRYAKHVYAVPYRGYVKRVSAVQANNITTVSMKWLVSQPASRPIDRTEAEYAIAIPEANLACPAGASWTTGSVARDTNGDDGAVFRIDTVLNSNTNLDSCLWVRIKNYHDHDDNWSASSPMLTQKGVLTSPEFSGLGVEVSDATNHIVTIKVTNNSSVPDSKIAVLCKRGDNAEYVCGIITNSDATNIRCLPWSDSSTVKFGIYAFQGSYKRTELGSYIYRYAVTANMKSPTVWYGGTIPAEPRNVTATISNPGEVLLSWTSTWLLVNKTEISWSKNVNAWESTDEPSTYLMNSPSNKIRVPNLEIGTTWYFRVRFAKETENSTVYGPYCDPVAISLTSAPDKPILMLSSGVISTKETLKLSWTYESTDGTQQSFYEVWTANVNDSTDEVTPVTRLFSYYTASHTHTVASYDRGIMFKKMLTIGTQYYLIIRVRSSSGLMSDWSDPVPFVITAPLTCRITQTSLSTVTVQDGESDTRSAVGLTALPLTLTVTGSGAGGQTSVVIERTAAYQMDRPDESVFNGYENEAVVSFTQNGEDQITITRDMLVGSLDDGAQYQIVATIQDSYGQTATARKKFIVKWAHQAVMPTANVEFDNTNLVSFITPVAPSGVATGDVCDIYRLSADKPELIVQDGVWGTKYVDPYPAIGEYGGHRVVFRTINGDYITADNHPAWIDLGEVEGDNYYIPDAIIDFDGDRAVFRYNMNLDTSWKKDFKETKYLGGSVQGDWNAGISRTGSISSVAVTSMDPDLIRALRRLAVYTGVCHVRTPDGSSYAADVQVSESMDLGRAKEIVNFTLNITRVDPEGFDGMTYDQWIETVEVEEEEEEAEG